MPLGNPDSAVGTIELIDGRTLGFAEYGDGNGRPVFHFHGFPGARVEAEILRDASRRAGIRLIGVDRPGMGLSSFLRERRLLDWPGDVIQLADALEIGRFAVAGVSGGGPYAAVCAFRLPDRLSGCGVIAGTGPPGSGSEELTRANRRISLIARRSPLLLQPILWRAVGRFRDDADRIETIISGFADDMPEVDRAPFDDPAIRHHLSRVVFEAFRQGTRGPARDARIIYGEPWGFALEDITGVRVLLWHGDLDRNVPVSTGRAVASSIPDCIATFDPEQGHLSLLVEKGEEILRRLVD